MSIYKKFSPLDYATVPFNAHKQYDFTSASAVNNKITTFDTRWTSESIGNYSSGSKSGSWERADVINNIKYNQLDHLYYRNYKRDVNNKLGNSHYLKQRRVLYENANILSIPAGLYGHQIKPGSFFLSSSDRRIVDDKNGNLMIEGTNVSEYVTDPRANVLNIGPVKGFKRYDLNTIEGYLNDVFYRDGVVNPEQISVYNTPDSGDEFDDSYYFNIIKYKDVTFSEKQLFDFDEFPGINFNGSSSEIRIGHDEKFNFNKGDDFTIMFFVGENELLEKLNVAGKTNYILSKSTTKTVIPSPSEARAGILTTQSTGSSQTKDIFSENQYPFEIYLEHANNGPHIFFRRSDGDIITTISASFPTESAEKRQVNLTPGNDFITSSINTETETGVGAFFANADQQKIHLIDSDEATFFGFTDMNDSYFYINGGYNQHPNSLGQVASPGPVPKTQQSGLDLKLDFDMFGMAGASPVLTEVELKFEDLYKSHGRVQISGSNDGFTWTGIAEEKDALGYSNYSEYPDTAVNEFIISKLGGLHQKAINRRFVFSNDTPYKWYRLRFEDSGFFKDSGYDETANLSYLGTETNVPLNDTTIYTSTPNRDLTINEINFFTGTRTPHVTCRASSSQMQIFIDGNTTGTSGSDNSVKQTQNTANLYIGSKGGTSNHFSGSLSQINIFNRALTDQQVTNHYQSSDGSPYVGNIFYSSGIIAITQPGVEETALATLGLGEMIIGETLIISADSPEGKAFTGINKLQFQGSHLIYEHEYQCTIDEHEFTDTLNLSARKIKSQQSQDLADFATGSLFRPYITTVGLYNEDNELLVVGKLGQPIRTSNETDTTLIVRWDT